MFPKLKENVWHINPERPTATLITSKATFEVPTEPALEFLKIRSHCTGHNSIDEIAQKSGLGVSDVKALLGSLEPAGIVYTRDVKAPDVAEARDILTRMCEIWSQELRISYIGNEFAMGNLPRSVLVGWLFEMYHYIRDFPHAIEHAAKHATGELETVLRRYAQQELGHEVFVLQTLVNLGFSRDEVESSIPLLSTRLIGFLMREMFELEPASILLVAAIIEAPEFNTHEIAAFKLKLSQYYGIDVGAFDPYFRHQEIDVAMGHADLFASHGQFITINDRQLLDDLVNKIHDLKHAFDLQGYEIKAYFTDLHGKYVPRQSVEFASI